MKNNILIPMDSKLAWIRLCLVFIICGIGFIGMWSIVMIMPAIQNEFQIERSSMVIPYVLTMIGFGIGNILVGKYSDKHGIIKPILYAFSLLIIVYFLSVFSTNLITLSLFQCVLGFSSATFFGPMMADITNFFEKKRGLAISIIASSQHLAGAAWPFLLQIYLSTGDWRESHIMIGLICLIVIPPICYFIFKMRPVSDRKLYVEKSYDSNKLNLSNRNFQILLMIAGIGCCVGMSTPQVHIIPLCLDSNFGLSVGNEILSIMLFCASISRIIFGYVSDKLGPLETLLLCSTLQAITLMLFIPYNSLQSLYVISILFGLSQGGIVPSYAFIVSKYLPKKEIAERVGLIIFMTVVGMSIGGWMSGKIYDLTNSYTLGFLNSIIWNFANIAIILYMFIKIKNFSIFKFSK